MRRPRLVIAWTILKTAWPELSGRAYLAAARSRSRWVLAEGCPVLALHCSFGFAPHIGQPTDSICFNLSFSGFTATELKAHPGRPAWRGPMAVHAMKQHAD